MTCPQYNLERATTLEEAADLGIYSVIMGSVNVAIHRFIWELLKSVKVNGHGAIDDFNAKYPRTMEGTQLNLRQLQGLDHILELEEKYLVRSRVWKSTKSQARRQRNLRPAVEGPDHHSLAPIGSRAARGPRTTARDWLGAEAQQGADLLVLTGCFGQLRLADVCWAWDRALQVRDRRRGFLVDDFLDLALREEIE